LREAEKLLYLEAVNKLKTTPRKGAPDAGPGNNIYDTFVMIHEQNDNKAYAHQTAGFLAWHRKFLIELESAIRSVDAKFKCVTLPYWDWTSETFGCKKHFESSASLDTPGCDTYHAASDLLTRFGGPGDATKTEGAFGSSGAGPVGCVTTGPFAGWVDHKNRCLSRGVNWKVTDQKPFVGRTEMLKILHYTEYGNQYDKEGFRVVLEGVPHGATHNYLGGHMRSFISPADPIFFSHHCYIDKLWTIWQDCHGHDTPEIKELLQTGADSAATHKYYEATHQTHYENDGVNDPMLFKMQFMVDIGGTETCPTQGKFCQKSNEACAACIHAADPWCADNEWDVTCCNLCTQPKCEAACGAETPPDIDFNEVGPSHLKDWVIAEKTPADVHTVKAMMNGRSYSYAQDEIEKYLLQMAPESLGECVIETKAASSLMSVAVLEETRSFHHTNQYRGKVARSFAEMVARAFNNTKREMAQANRAQQYQHAMKAAQKEECEMMASKCNGDYKREYQCKTDQPRFFLPWLGDEQWKQIMKNSDMKHAVFQDPCCAGDEDALQPGAVKCIVGGR
jgi:tyrosinase